MKTRNLQEIERLLADDEPVAPPPELAAQLKADIPDPLLRRTIVRRVPAYTSLWKIAALLLLAVSAVVVFEARRRPMKQMRQAIRHRSPAETLAKQSPPASPATVPAPVPEVPMERIAANPPRRRTTRGATATLKPSSGTDSTKAESTATLATAGQIFVRVTDESGGLLPGVTVTLSGLGQPRETTTGARGQARFLNLPPGSYSLKAELSGFATMEHPNVVVAEGTSTVLAVPMRIASVATTITVESSSPLLDTRKQTSGTNYTQQGSAIGQPMPTPQMSPSTGGTTEPNGQAYGDMFFHAAGVNPFVDTDDERFSTFGLDVDTGSYTLGRKYLSEGHLPPPESVRVEEYLNFFRYGDPTPGRGDVSLRIEGGPSPFGHGPLYRIVRINVRARDVDAEDRKPAILTFVIDISGSMGWGNRLGLVKQALDVLLDQLKPGDRVGLVVFGSNARVLLPHTDDVERLRQAIDALAPEGSTNTEEGLVEGFRLAAGAYRRTAINRVILCSDGVANVGNTSAESILASVARMKREDIELSTVGFGMGNYNDVLMEQLADQGHGNHHYVDSLKEARRAFEENLTGMLQTIGSDAKAQVEFDPDAVSRYRLIGYENRAIANDRFRDDRVVAGQIGAGQSVTALYEIKMKPDVAPQDVVADVHLRYRSVRTSRVVEESKPFRSAEFARSAEKASPSFRLSVVVAEFAEVLRDSYWAKSLSLGRLGREANAVAKDFRGDASVREFVDLVRKAAALKSPASLDTAPGPNDDDP